MNESIVSPKLQNLFETACLVGDEDKIEAGLTILLRYLFKQPEAKKHVLDNRERHEQELKDAQVRIEIVLNRRALAFANVSAVKEQMGFGTAQEAIGHMLNTYQAAGGAASYPQTGD